MPTSSQVIPIHNENIGPTVPKLVGYWPGEDVPEDEDMFGTQLSRFTGEKVTGCQIPRLADDPKQRLTFMLPMELDDSMAAARKKLEADKKDKALREKKVAELTEGNLDPDDLPDDMRQVYEALGAKGMQALQQGMLRFKVLTRY
jgi:hypothetical protein